MKKKGLSMNLIMALTLTAVAVSVLLCANLVFMQTYRQTLLRNAETTSRQAIAQASSTMNEYLEDMNDAVTLLTGYLDLPAEEREARFEAFLEIRADVVAVTTYDAEGGNAQLLQPWPPSAGGYSAKPLLRPGQAGTL